jgi:hypothetical protein
MQIIQKSIQNIIQSVVVLMASVGVLGTAIAQEKTEVLESKYATMATYEGLRDDQTSQEMITVKFQKYDFTPPGIWLNLRFDKKPGEKAVKADHFLFELELSIEEYAKIFESTEKLEKFNIGPHDEVSQGDLYQLNLVDAESDEKTQVRTVTIKTVIGDQGVQTRSYLTTIKIENKKIVSLTHVKQLRRKGLFGPGKFETVADFSAKTLNRVRRGLDIKEYGWVKKDENIESAARDASPENLEKIVADEK